MSDTHSDASSKRAEEASKGIGGVALAGLAVAGALVGYFLYGPEKEKNRAHLRGWVVKAKGEILEEIESLEEVSKEKYQEIVEKVMNTYYEHAGVHRSEVDALKDKFMKFADTLADTVDEKFSALEKVLDDDK